MSRYEKGRAAVVIQVSAWAKNQQNGAWWCIKYIMGQNFYCIWQLCERIYEEGQTVSGVRHQSHRSNFRVVSLYSRFYDAFLYIIIYCHVSYIIVYSIYTHRYVLGADLAACARDLYHRYRDCKDADSYLAGETLHDVVLLPGEYNTVYTILACADCAVRF